MTRNDLLVQRVIQSVLSGVGLVQSAVESLLPNRLEMLKLAV